jgi:AcrR family transcriptional regulator
MSLLLEGCGGDLLSKHTGVLSKLSSLMSSSSSTPRRAPLSRERVLQAAVALADREGLDTLTMRRLGTELGVEAMSLYRHVANKEEILDGMIELVVAEIEIPRHGAEWREEMRRRAISAREVLGRHSWAIGLLETRRSMGTTVLRYLDAILGNLRSAGFPVEDAAHAFWLLDSFVYGQVIQETTLPFATPEEISESTASILEQITRDEYPYLVEMGEHALTTAYSFDSEFEFGLDLILDALERVVSARARRPAPGLP